MQGEEETKMETGEEEETKMEVEQRPITPRKVRKPTPAVENRNEILASAIVGATTASKLQALSVVNLMQQTDGGRKAITRFMRKVKRSREWSQAGDNKEAQILAAARFVWPKMAEIQQGYQAAARELRIATTQNLPRLLRAEPPPLLLKGPETAEEPAFAPSSMVPVGAPSEQSFPVIAQPRARARGAGGKVRGQSDVSLARERAGPYSKVIKETKRLQKGIEVVQKSESALQPSDPAITAHYFPLLAPESEGAPRLEAKERTKKSEEQLKEERRLRDASTRKERREAEILERRLTLPPIKDETRAQSLIPATSVGGKGQEPMQYAFSNVNQEAWQETQLSLAKSIAGFSKEQSPADRALGPTLTAMQTGSSASYAPISGTVSVNEDAQSLTPPKPSVVSSDSQQYQADLLVEARQNEEIKQLLINASIQRAPYQAPSRPGVVLPPIQEPEPEPQSEPEQDPYIRLYGRKTMRRVYDTAWEMFYRDVEAAKASPGFTPRSAEELFRDIAEETRMREEDVISILKEGGNRFAEMRKMSREPVEEAKEEEVPMEIDPQEAARNRQWREQSNDLDNRMRAYFESVNAPDILARAAEMRERNEQYDLPQEVRASARRPGPVPTSSPFETLQQFAQEARNLADLGGGVVARGAKIHKITKQGGGFFSDLGKAAKLASELVSEVGGTAMQLVKGGSRLAAGDMGGAVDVGVAIGELIGKLATTSDNEALQRLGAIAKNVSEAAQLIQVLSDPSKVAPKIFSALHPARLKEFAKKGYGALSSALELAFGKRSDKAALRAITAKQTETIEEANQNLLVNHTADGAVQPTPTENAATETTSGDFRFTGLGGDEQTQAALSVEEYERIMEKLRLREQKGPDQPLVTADPNTVETNTNTPPALGYRPFKTRPTATELPIQAQQQQQQQEESQPPPSYHSRPSFFGQKPTGRKTDPKSAPQESKYDPPTGLGSWGKHAVPSDPSGILSSKYGMTRAPGSAPEPGRGPSYPFFRPGTPEPFEKKGRIEEEEKPPDDPDNPKDEALKDKFGTTNDESLYTVTGVGQYRPHLPMALENAFPILSGSNRRDALEIAAIQHWEAPSIHGYPQDNPLVESNVLEEGIRMIDNIEPEGPELHWSDDPKFYSETFQAMGSTLTKYIQSGNNTPQPLNVNVKLAEQLSEEMIDVFEQFDFSDAYPTIQSLMKESKNLPNFTETHFPF